MKKNNNESNQMQHILIIGATTTLSYTNCIIDCTTWEDMSSISKGISDYDYIIFCTNEAVTSFDYQNFRTLFNSKTFEQSILNGSHLLIIGPPYIILNGDSKHQISQLIREDSLDHLLNWTNLRWRINSHSGINIKQEQYTPDIFKFGSFSQLLSRTNGYICSIEQPVISDKPDLRLSTGDSQLIYSLKNVISTRFSAGIFSEATIYRRLVYTEASIKYFRTPVQLGKIFLLFFTIDGKSPGLDEVLSCLFEAGISEIPSWTNNIALDAEMAHRDCIKNLNGQIVELQNSILLSEGRISQIRRPLSILYQIGKTLEGEVAFILEALGFNVSIPLKSNAEDCFATYPLQGGDICVILEVKSTKKDTVSEEGIRQVLAWKADHSLAGNDVKGVVVVNSAILKEPPERKNPYSIPAVKAAEIQDILLMTTIDLYVIYQYVTRYPIGKDSFLKSVLSSRGLAKVENFIASEVHCEIMSELSGTRTIFDQDGSEKS